MSIFFNPNMGYELVEKNEKIEKCSSFSHLIKAYLQTFCVARYWLTIAKSLIV